MKDFVNLGGESLTSIITSVYRGYGCGGDGDLNGLTTVTPSYNCPALKPSLQTVWQPIFLAAVMIAASQ